MKIHFLLHETFEGPGCIESWAVNNRHTMSFSRLYDAEFSFPEDDEFDVLVIMGGGMSVYENEKFPWLIAEKQFLRRAMENHKKVLGICLGAQLLASAMGADVYPGEKEIGWHPVEFTSAAIKKWGFPQDKKTVFHWHGDTFDIPKGSDLLAGSAGNPNQGFMFGDNVLGLQFHFECTRKSIEKLITYASNDFKQGDFVQSPLEIRQGYIENVKPNNEMMFKLLDRFLYGT